MGNSLSRFFISSSYLFYDYEKQKAKSCKKFNNLEIIKLLSQIIYKKINLLDYMKINYALVLIIAISFISCIEKAYNNNYSENYTLVLKADSAIIINQSNKYLKIDPVSLTASSCDRSLGTINDFYSEGDYWWPNPLSPDSPYVKKDGLTNPENFKDHRVAMRNMSIYIATLTAAYRITLDQKYAKQAVKHLTAWFIDKETRMNPNMNYAQAIKGICPGRGVGLIDGIHLVEPARAVSVLKNYNGIDDSTLKSIKSWFSEFILWMTNHEYGIDERERKNNHGSAWVMQLAEFSRLTENEEMLQYCRERFKNVLLPNQMAGDGSFPMELERTKPYGYSLFNTDILSILCQIASTPDDNLWTFKLSDGRGMELGIKYIKPYIEDKSIWPLNPDVMYWDEWPVRHPALLFAGMAFGDEKYISLWEKLSPMPKTEEGIRNFPLRQPVLWVD